MKRPPIVAAAATIAVLGTGGLLTTIGPWYGSLRKPPLQPPNWLFGPAWTLIGVLTTCSAVLGWNTARTDVERRRLIVLFAANGGLNVLWSALFFKRRRPDWALVEVAALWVSVAAMIASLAGRSRRAAWLLSPYLLWVAFAAYLNLEIVRLNAPFRAARRGG